MTKVISIQDVVRDFLSEKGEYTDANYLRYLKMALRGFANLNIHTVKSFKTVTLELNELRQAQLPSDYINWARIGIVRNGQLVSLDVNEDLLMEDIIESVTDPTDPDDPVIPDPSEPDPKPPEEPAPDEPVGDTNIMYGRLYNWYAASDSLIAPHGYRVATESDWLLLNDVLETQAEYKVKSDVADPDPHPRWNTLAGSNTSGLTVVPNGARVADTFFAGLGSNTVIWTDGTVGSLGAMIFLSISDDGDIEIMSFEKNRGAAIRCVRENLAGWVEGQKVADLDGNIYDTVKIGEGSDARVWLVQNLAVTQLRNGTSIPNLIVGSQWGQATTPARCDYNLDESWVFLP